MKKTTNDVKNTKTLVRVLKYLKGNVVFLFISLIIAIAIVALTLYIPVLIGDAVDLALGKDNVDLEGIAKILLLMGIVILITAVLQWVMGVINNRLTYSVVKRIRSDVFKKLQIHNLTHRII